MDVTSLLNSNSSLAAGQQNVEKSEKEKSTSPPRNRTPWDAGGYSLPINTVSTLSSSSNVQPIHDDAHSDSTFSSLAQTIHDEDSRIGNSRIDDSRNDRPNSPKHKFSDSRSSLSSFTSSQQSISHSRFSSMSTVASSQLAINNEKLPQESRRTTPQPHSPINELRVRSSLSPTGSLETLAVAAERRQSRQEPVSPMQETTDAMSATNISPISNEVNGRGESQRPGSPSDAILIRRPSAPSLKLITDEVTTLDQNQHSSAYFSAPPLQHQSTYTAIPTRHKRAASAPDFPPNMVTEYGRRASASFGATAEPTPPPSHQLDQQTPPNTMRYTTAPDTPPATAADLESQPVACMYIKNCDTGSQPRKAISHIFGRNKMCTRLIPQHVWVHYCRKHYQRSRYRNPKEYAKLQCDLVQQQIRRVHDWSEENIRRGEAGIVQDWGLAVRKREQKRLDDLGGANRKRSAAAFDRADSDDEDEDDARGNPVPATAVPQWLLKLCGKGYSTERILSIFSRLHELILEDAMPCFPDIEILPNIVVDQDEPKSPKGYTKRKPFATGHKRSQSLGVAVKPHYYSQPPSEGRRMSQPVTWTAGDMYGSSPLQKRRRPNEDEFLESGMNQFQRPRMVERAMDGRRGQALPHRPTFANIEENQADENDYRDQSRTMYFSHSPSPASFRAPLPAPTPQRHTPSMAAHLETSNENPHVPRRPLHSRSQSDVGSFHRGPIAYGQPPPSVYNMSSNYQNPQVSMVHRGQEQMNNYSYAQPQPQPQHSQPRYHEAPVRQHPYADARPMRPVSGPGHGRHQSTPMIPQHLSHQAQQMSCAPVHHGYQYSQNPNGNLPPPPRIIESQHSQDLYGPRR